MDVEGLIEWRCGFFVQLRAIISCELLSVYGDLVRLLTLPLPQVESARPYSPVGHQTMTM